MNKVHLQLAGRVKIHNCDETNRNIDAVNDAKTTTMSLTMCENHDDVVDDARKPHDVEVENHGTVERMQN